MFATAQKAHDHVVPLPASEPPSTQESSLWFRLPLELREEIYDYFFSNNAMYGSAPLYISPENDSVFASPVAKGSHRAALLRTCKAIQTEAWPFLHAPQHINLEILDSQALSGPPISRLVERMGHPPQTPVCSRDHMLQLITNRLKHVSITVRLTYDSPYTLIVQHLAWIIEMLRRRERKLHDLILRVLNNVGIYVGCWGPTGYMKGSIWDIYPEMMLVETSESCTFGEQERSGSKLLDAYAEEWRLELSMTTGRMGTGDDADGLWKELLSDLKSVERVLEEPRFLWAGMGSNDVWDSISTRSSC